VSNNSNLLDFDDVQPVEVRIGGKVFVLRPQSASVIQKVLEYSSVDAERPINTEETGAEQNKDPRQAIRDGFSTWNDNVAAVALMLGVDTSTQEGRTEQAHLEEHLSPRVIMGIFERWWEVNEVDAFLERGFRVLMPVDYLRRLREFREATTQALVAAAVKEAQETTDAPNPPETTTTVH